MYIGPKLAYSAIFEDAKADIKSNFPASADWPLFFFLPVGKIMRKPSVLRIEA